MTAIKKWQDGSQGNTINELYADQYFNQLFWGNDPDVVFLSSSECEQSEEEIKTMCYLSGILASSVNTSSQFTDPKSLALWKFISPPTKVEPASFPFWGSDQKLIVITRYYKELDSWAVLIINPTSELQSGSFLIRKIRPGGESFVYDWSHTGSKAMGNLPEIKVDLKSHHSALFYLTKNNTAPPDKLSLGGNLF